MAQVQQMLRQTSPQAAQDPRSARHVSTQGRLCGVFRRAQRSRRPQADQSRFTVSAVYGSYDADGNDAAAAASLQSQDEAYLLSPLGTLSALTRCPCSRWTTSRWDAGVWQKGLLGRIGRFAGAHRIGPQDAVNPSTDYHSSIVHLMRSSSCHQSSHFVDTGGLLSFCRACPVHTAGRSSDVSH